MLQSSQSGVTVSPCRAVLILVLALGVAAAGAVRTAGAQEMVGQAAGTPTGADVFTVSGIAVDATSSDAVSARAQAVRTAREIMADGILEGLDRTGWISRVYDETGRVVATVKFSDLVQRRGFLS